MDLSNVSKAIAGAVVGIAVMWISNLWSIDVPSETVSWLEGTVDTVIGAIIGYIFVWIAPANKKT